MLAARVMGGGAKEPMKLERLQGDDFVELFNRYAFAGVNPGEFPTLKDIGMHIVSKLCGCPLLEKTVGTLLRAQLDDWYWTNVLGASASILVHTAQQGDTNIMKILKLSYHHLSAHLQPCLVYCRTFPKGYKFDKKNLIYMWMALGLVQKSPRTPEDEGNHYIDELVKRSFLHPDGWYINKFVMHDLPLEVALLVSNNECLSLVGDKLVGDIPNTVLHLYLKTSNLNLLGELGKLKNLRTLTFCFRGDDCSQEYAKVLDRVFKSIKSIRVLILKMPFIKVLPDSIGDLRHLRLLSVDVYRGSHFQKLPEIMLPKFLCKLYHLQIIDITNDLTKYSECMNRLTSLRHIRPMPHHGYMAGVGKLVSLQELSFSVCEVGGYKIEELKNLNQLHHLVIEGLEKVTSCNEATMAELLNKEHLQELQLKWSPRTTALDMHEEILDILQPPSTLKKICIGGYDGCSAANWMERDLIKNVEYIELQNCTRWECLPPLGKLPCLKHLKLSNMPAVKKLDCEGGFSRLEVLEIEKLNQWEGWSTGSRVEMLHWCPRLRKLTIRDCPEVKILRSLPLSLRELILANVALTVLPTFSPLDSNSSSACSTSSSSFAPFLSYSEITNCRQLASLGKILLQHNLIVRDLWIENCEELVDLAVEDSGHICSIEEMLIRNCRKLQVLPSLPHSLKKLKLDDVGLTVLPTSLLAGDNSSSVCSSTSSLSSAPILSKLIITNCEKLTSLNQGLLQQNLASLKKLKIKNCKELVALPMEGFRHICSLNSLVIENCPKLLQLVPRADDGYFLPSSLEKLSIGRCGDWERSSPTLLQGGLTSFSKLKLSGCNNFTSLPSNVGVTLSSHKKSSIERCPKLVQEATAAADANSTEEDFTLTVDHLMIDDPLLLLIEPLKNLTSVRR